MEETLYEVLGVAEDAAADLIKKEYRRLAKQCHPDHHPGREDQFRKITHAYQILSDPISRADYDRTLRIRRSGAGRADDFFDYSTEVAGNQIGKMIRELARHASITKVKISYQGRRVATLSFAAAAALQSIAFVLNPVLAIVANIGMSRVFKVEVSNRVVERYEKGVRLHQEGRLSEAEELYNQCLRTSAYFVPAVLNLGMLYRQRGERQKAAEQFHKIIEIAPVGELARIAHQNLQEMQQY